MEYLKIKNWIKYQHYKDRNPPWIKLYHSILDDYEYACLQDDSKLLLISLFMLAGRTDNHIPNDPKWIQSKAMLTKKIDIQPLINTGFISIDGNDSKMIADCKQNDTQRRDRDREETEKKKNGMVYPEWLDLDLWKEFKKYRTSIKSPMTIHAEKLCLADLKTQMDVGYKQSDIINHTIKSGKWKSFYPPKNKQAEKTYPTSDFGDDLFLKQAFEFMGPGYTDEDFNNHCHAFGHKPEVIRAKIKEVRG